MNQLSFQSVVEAEFDGLKMGVLSDGTGYLSARSLAKLCGTAPSAFITQALNWRLGKRDSKLARMLIDRGITRRSLHFETAGNEHAYTDDVCMVVLEYYAFEADRPTATALASYRKLGQGALRAMIYKATGFEPRQVVEDKWKQFHDRMTLNTCPKGFFSVFQEMSSVVLSAIRHGLQIDEKTLPDISVGQAWGKHWQEGEFDAEYGARETHPHVFPEYFPQAKAGRPDAWIYPNGALGIFRDWLQNDYLPRLYPNYLAGKVKQGLLPEPSRSRILEAVVEAPALAASTSLAAKKRLP